MTATQENACPVVGATETGRKSTHSSYELSRRHFTKRGGTRQDETRRNFTKNDVAPVIVTCNIDNRPMSRKPDKGEYGAMRYRMKTHTLDASRLFNGILQGYSFTPAALGGTGGDSWREQRLFAVDIDNHPGDENPLTVQEALLRMKARNVEPLFGYYTFSDTEEVPRFRIIIATDETVTDREQALKITQGFQSLFPESADKSAGDLARVFLGTNNGPCRSYTGRTNPVSRLLELYHEGAEVPEQTTVHPASGGESDLARAIEDFDMGAYVSASEGLQGKPRNGEMMFNPCPICGHKDDFYTKGNVWHCFGANNPSGKPGGNIINYLEARHGFTREQAREYFMYDILKWDREDKPAAAKVTKDTKDTDFASFVPFEKPASESLPPFPWEALPPALSDMAETLSDFAETDYALAAVPALANCAVAVGRKFLVSPKPGWNEPLNLYALSAAVTGEGKSAVMKWLNRPLADFQREWNREHAAIVDNYRDELELTEAEIASTKKRIAAGKASRDDLSMLTERRRSLEENPERPLCLFVQDCTPEELERLLADNRETISIICDEGGIMETLTGGRYKDGVNLECLLNGFTGGTVQTNRVGRKAVYLESPCINVNVMCQPVTAQDLTANATFNRRGLTGRFLYAFPPSKGGGRKGNRPEPLPEAVDVYNELIRALLGIAFVKDAPPRVVEFSDEAYKAYLEFFAEKESLLRQLDPEAAFRGWAARMHGHAVRLAGVLHVCEHLQEADAVPLSADTFHKAVTLTRYFKAHAEYAFSLSGASMSQAERDARYIWKRIRESGQAQFSKRDLIRRCQRFKKAEEMDAGINELVAHGYIRVVKSGEGRGRKAETIETNPEAEKEN